MKQKDMTCSCCGKLGCVAQNLCPSCYQRKRLTGTLEYKKRKRGPNPDNWGENTRRVFTMYKSGVSQSDIARNLGISRQRVSQIICTYGKKINYYRLIHMSMQELADWLVMNGNGEDYQTWLSWLQQEASDGKAP